MAKSVNMETTAATYDTEITKAGEFYDAMGTQESYFNEGLSSIGDYVTTSGGLMGSWAADDVQTKFQDFITNDVTKTKEDISSNLSGGSFLSLKNTVNQVKNDLTECKDAKQKYDAALKAVDSAQKAYNDAQQATARASAENKEAAKDYESAKKTALDEANAAAKTAKSTLASKVNTTNTHFTELTQFVYNGAGPAGSNGNGGAETPAPPTTSEPETAEPDTTEPENTVPDSWTNEIPDNIGKDGYYPDIYIDPSHGIDFSGAWFLNQNYPRTSEGFHYVWNEGDQCYYEVHGDDAGNAGWFTDNPDGSQTWNSNVYTPYNDIPEGESPSEYGYTPVYPNLFENAKILNR